MSKQIPVGVRTGRTSRESRSATATLRANGGGCLWGPLPDSRRRKFRGVRGFMVPQIVGV
jgi:hypothetical protein